MKNEKLAIKFANEQLYDISNIVFLGHTKNEIFITFIYSSRQWFASFYKYEVINYCVPIYELLFNDFKYKKCYTYLEHNMTNNYSFRYKIPIRIREKLKLISLLS